MISALFDQVTRFSLRARWLVIILAAVALVAGVVAMTSLNLELLPRIEFPQTVVVVQWSDSESADEFLEEITVPLEERLSTVSGVVNVESTTSSGFAFIIARNEFGLDQDDVVRDIEDAVASVSLPEGVEEPDVLNFSLSDLPVVVASASSGELTLPELKTLVTEDLQPRLESLEDVSRVSVSGGQELPEESEAVVEAEPEVAETTEDPGRLPDLFAEGARAMDLDIEYAQDVTPEVLAQMAGRQGITGEQILTMLNMIPPETLPFAPPETLVLLPQEFVSTLDPSLQSELDDLAATQGGIGRYTVDELLAMFSGEESQGEPTSEATLESPPTSEATSVSEAAETVAAPEIEPVDLPDSWTEAAAQAGQVLETTADVTPEVMGFITSLAPQLLGDLEPPMWRAIEPEAVLTALPLVQDDLDPALLQQLEAIQTAAAGEVPEAVSLPESWVQAAGTSGFAIETTADVPPEAIRLISSAAPQLLDDLTDEMILSLSPETLAALPDDFVAGLDEGLRETLVIMTIRREQLAATPEVETEGEATAEPTATSDPARLPDVLIQGAQGFGLDIKYAYDIPPDFVRQISAIGPQGLQVLQLLTPDNLRALQPEAIALLPADFLESLEPELRAELDELAAPYGGAGQLAIEEAEAAAEAASSAPPLAGIWLEPGQNGEPSQFQTAADILNNPFVPGAAPFLNFFPNSPQVEDPADWMSALSPEVLAYLAENEEGFVENLSPVILELMSSEGLTFLLDNYGDAFDPELADRLRGIAAGEIAAFTPEASITRTDGNPSLLLSLFKAGDANTVDVAHRVFDELDAYEQEHPEVTFNLPFEQASFIEDSIEGVSREGALGALFAVIIILLFLSGHVGGKYRLNWRATVVTGVSIPLSVLIALVVMRWLPPTLGQWLHDLSESSGNGALAFISRLFPTSVTLNIMTLSGLTVAVGRVVDDSIVVLENIFRHVQKGADPRMAVIDGTKEVAIAIFASTATTVAVFLPLGLLGGIIGSFFLPFGFAVTYALGASFLVAITVVPALAYLLIRKEHLPEERETTLQRWYTPLLEWALTHRGATMAIATLIFLGSLALLGQLPQSFIPSLGEPTINVVVQLPEGTLMADTDALVSDFEATLAQLEGIETIQAEVGSGGGIEAFFGGGGVSQNVANLTISIEDQELLSSLTNEIRDDAETVFGQDNVVVSAASQTGFSGFSLIVTGESTDQLRTLVPDVKEALASVDVDENGLADIANISSNVDSASAGGNGTIIRIDGRPAVSFSGELETDNTLGVTNAAKQAVADLASLPPGVEVTEGFESQQQVEGFRSMVAAIGYSILIVYAIMALTFRSLIHPFTILFSLPFALVGAALALFISNSVLGISAMIGLMMLVGIVVTNAIVLMELVQQLRRRGESAYNALVRAGRTRLRPIWMTALAAILALIPLAVSGEAGAIIASELARAVIGGLLVSTLLTLVVVPVVYSLFDQLAGRIRRTEAPQT